MLYQAGQKGQQIRVDFWRTPCCCEFGSWKKLAISKRNAAVEKATLWVESSAAFRFAGNLALSTDSREDRCTFRRLAAPSVDAHQLVVQFDPPVGEIWI